ncbi:MAG: GHKL domain-containing protein [Schwartzia sp.]|nr:GHKL domain-containing protein [Schwartzia sp. (in: firmicutes)]
MNHIFSLSIGLTTIQLLGAYLRYLPFEEELTVEEQHRLWKYLAAWALAAVIIYVGYFAHAGVTEESYRQISFLGGFPFLGVSFLVLPRSIPRHLFIIGMQTLWLLLVHTVAGMFILSFLPMFASGIERTLIQTALFITFFLLLLPLVRPVFRHLLPPTQLFDDRPLGWYLALLPLGLCASPIINFLRRTFIYSWTDRIERLLLLAWVFVIYRYVILLSRRMAAARQREAERRVLAKEVNALENYASLLAERDQSVRRLQHDLRHYTRMMTSLLQNGQTEEALALITAEDEAVMASSIPAYCQSPIINAALAVYLRLASQAGVRTTYKVQLDDPGRGKESVAAADTDLAVMLSNVLENAVNASRKQPPGEREIRLSLRFISLQYVLSVENRYDAPLALGPGGLPMTSEPGHGTGMESLTAFRDKYRAELVFEQEDGWVQLMMYWLGDEERAGAPASAAE